MRLPSAPNLGSPRRMALTALAVTVVVGAILGYIHWDDLDISFGDTDDATRLVMVRALLGGQGWWDQHLIRFQPPVGVFMHWSRLLDGAIAALDAILRLGLSADDAETATRFIWPLLWIAPISLAALGLARRLDGGRLKGAAVLVCAVILVSDISLFVQFRPGRIDHHDVQMAFCLLALSGAAQGGRKTLGTALAGFATGLGLAVGLEAILFDAIIGAAVALRFVADPGEAKALRVYGAALALTTLAAYGIQTPPARWGLALCDAMAANLVAALAIAGLGVVLAAWATAARSRPARFAALSLVALAAGGVYFALDPNCRHGFFADVDPRIRPIWLNFVQEVRPIDKIWKRDAVQAVGFITPWVIGVVAWAALGLRRERRRDPAWLLVGACLIPGVVIAAGAIRMTGYAEWFAVPALAAAGVELAGLASRRYGTSFLVVLLAAALVSPTVVDGLAIGAAKLVPAKPTGKAKGKMAKGKARPDKAPADECFDTDSYDELADAEPAGLVLSEVDLGPFVLANTDDSAMAGPYHRLSYGILKAYSILSAPADDRAATLARQAGVRYVLECRFHAKHGDRDLMARDSLQKRLDRGQPPAWLAPLSPKGAPLQAYRVLPAPPPLSPLPRPAAQRSQAAPSRVGS